MTDLKTAITAINKWLFFGWNYECIWHEWKSIHGTSKAQYVPRFLAEAKWTCNFDHMLEKWRNAYCRSNGDSHLVAFYADIDNANRKILLEWVMNNYNDECKLYKD